MVDAMNSQEALCLDLFDKFCAANTFCTILTQFHKLCKQAQIAPARFPEFFLKLKAKLTSKDAQQFLAVYEKKVQTPTYQRGTICRDLTVLIIGTGPSGLRCAIECQLLGAKVVLIEKRDLFSRNNVLHIWPFVIQDLKGLGAKRFYPKFCVGAINHISISQLQHTLLKIALLLGVEVHAGIGFEKLTQPKASSSGTETTSSGWQISCELEDDSELDIISSIESQRFDVIIGANGRQCNLPGFKRKALRAKLAIAITANFVNKHTASEARVQEISGVSCIYKQSFFEDLYDLLGIDLENIVYYKDETHYFIMTAKKSSLLMKGVLKQDFSEIDDLLHPSNISKTALKSYILEAVDYATEQKLQNLEFALNYRGEPDFSVFDFTSMYASENACKIIERHGRKLVLALVGDSLLEPFWPMGTGCARGFLSALDAAWMIRSLAKGNSPLDVISERESIFKLLAQTTQENLSRNYSNYSVDPHSRYQHISIQYGKPYPIHIQELYDTGGSVNANANSTLKSAPAPQSNSNQISSTGDKSASLAVPDNDHRLQKSHSQGQIGRTKEENTKPKAASSESKLTSAVSNNGPCGIGSPRMTNANVSSSSDDGLNQNQTQPQKGESARATAPSALAASSPAHVGVDLESKSMSEKIDFLMEWIQSHVKRFRIQVQGIHDLFVCGDALCCLVHVFRPDLIPQFPFPPDVEEGIELVDAAAFRNQLAFDFLKQEYGILCAESGLDSTFYSFSNVPVLVDFLTQVYKTFKDESPRVNAPQPLQPSASANQQWQRKALWDEPKQQNWPPTVGKSGSIQRSATSSAIGSKYRRDNFKNNQPPFERTPVTEAARALRELNDVKTPSRFEKSPDRLRRLAEAEDTKNRALQFINQLKEKRVEERKAKTEACKQAIQSLEGSGIKSKPPPTVVIRARTAAAERASPPPSTADACSSAHQSTVEQDDFFNEYNMRLWRQSVPTIHERSKKLENNLLESAGLSKNSGVDSTPTRGIKQALREQQKQIYKMSDNALSIMQQKFGIVDTKGNTDKNAAPKSAPPSASSSPTPTPKKNPIGASHPAAAQKAPALESKPSNTSRTSQEAAAKVEPKPSRARQETKVKAVEPKPTNSGSNPKPTSSVARSRTAVGLDEKELAKTMFATNKRDGQLLSRSSSLSIHSDDIAALEDEIDEDSLNKLSKEEVDNILNWSGKYL